MNRYSSEKKLEQKIEKKLSYLDSLNQIFLESSQDGILILDNKDQITGYNNSFLKMWQIPKSLMESLDSEQLLTYILHRTLNTESYIQNCHLSRKYPKNRRIDRIEFIDGKVYERFSIPHFFQRKFLGRIIIIRDITLSYQHDKISQNTDQLYGELADSLPEVVFECDTKGCLTFVNDAGFKQFGINKETFARGINTLDMITDDDRARAKLNMERVLSGDIVGGAEYLALRADGTSFPVVIHTRPIKKNRQTYGLRGIAVDLSRIKAAEEKIKQREKWFRLVTENISDIVFVIDENFVINYVSPSISIILNVNPDEITGSKISEFIYPEDRNRLEKFIQETRENNKLQLLVEVRLEQFDKTIRFFEFSSSNLLTEPAINGIILNGRDVTYRKKMEEEAIKANKLESASILAGGIAHDFNNVLTGITGSAYLAKRFYKKTELIPGYMEQIENAVKKAKSLTQHLLSFAKEGEPTKIFIELEEWLKNTIAFSFHLSNVHFKYCIDEETKSVEIDTVQMGHVINNILKNSAEAMNFSGDIQISASTLLVDKQNRIPPLSEGDYVKISIQDSGYGISKADLQRVFDPYFTTKENAIGLGLSIAYTIVRKHEGTILIDSEEELGTTINIILPACRNETQKPKTHDQEIMHGAGKVLLMDDQKIVLDIGEEILQFLGYEVHCARNGEEAITLYQSAKKANQSFDVVILDLTITDGLGGWDTFKLLREFDPQIKAVASSGFTNNPIMAYWEKYGFSGVIAKPYKIANLSDVMFKLTNSKDESS